MTGEDIIAKVKKLNLKKGSYVVFGSGPLALLGIRESNDIDLLVSGELYAELQTKGWQQIFKSPDDSPLTYDVFEAHDNWNFSSYNPTLEDLLKRATEVGGISFASLTDVVNWKSAGHRDKDLADLKLINNYLKNTNKLD